MLLWERYNHQAPPALPLTNSLLLLLNGSPTKALVDSGGAVSLSREYVQRHMKKLITAPACVVLREAICANVDLLGSCFSTTSIGDISTCFQFYATRTFPDGILLRGHFLYLHSVLFHCEQGYVDIVR